MIHDGSGKLETVDHQEEANSENFVMGSDAAEFVDKVKDQVRNRQKRMSNVAESGEEHSIIWRMFMATTLNAATFMGKNFSTIQSVVKNHQDLTGGGGLARVPNLRVCEHLLRWGWHTEEGKDELTSCRGTV